MNNKKKILSMLLVIFFILPITSTIPADYSTTPSSAKQTADWTVMYYLCCDNHISYEGEGIVTNLTMVGSSNNFNLIVLKDGDKDGDSVLYYVEEGNAVSLNDVYSWPDELDMANPNTIKLFIELVMDEYPANHYALIMLSDHGSGWQGVCYDRSVENRGYTVIPMPIFANALKEVTSYSGKKIDIIGFMPCVTGMFEVAYELAPYADYMVASEEHMLEDLDNGPEYTWQYLQSTWNLKNNTGMTPEQFAGSIVDYYKSCDFPLWILYSYMVITKQREYGKIVEVISDILTKAVNKFRNPEFRIVALHTTLSAVNLSKINDVGGKINNLSSLLILHGQNYQIKQAIQLARKNVREYGKFYTKKSSTLIYYINFPIEKLAFDSFVDLYDIIQRINETAENQLVKDACLQLMKEIEDSIILNKAMQNDESHGLSIYFPENNKLYNKYLWGEEIPSPYEDLRFSKDTMWDEFLKGYLKV